MFSEQIQQGPVELVAVPVFVCDILTAGVENPEVAPEVPERKSNPVLRQDIENITEPGKEDFVRRFAPAAALPAMNSDPLLDQTDPGCVEPLELRPTEFLTIDDPGPDGPGRRIRVFEHPGGTIVRDVVRVVPAAALRDLEIGDLRNDGRADIVSIGDDESVRVEPPDRLGGLVR